jgi:hypothetical protein
MLGATAPASAQIDNYTLYNGLLAQECRASHLEWLSPAQLNDLIEIDFEGSLPKAEKAKLQRADNQKAMCATVSRALHAKTSHS